jgi:hypothetical protein
LPAASSASRRARPRSSGERPVIHGPSLASCRSNGPRFTTCPFGAGQVEKAQPSTSGANATIPAALADTAPAVLRVVLFDLSIALLLVLVIVVLSILK